MKSLKLLLGSFGSVILAGCVYRCICIVLDVGLQTIESPTFAVCEVLVLIVFSAIACIFVHMSLVLWSDHHSAFSVALLYTLNITIKVASNLASRTFEKHTKRFRETQEKNLLEGLKENVNTEYGKDFNFDKIHSLEDLKAKHPLTTYNHYQQYVERICNGEVNIMTKEKTTRLTLTSGTTGKAKKIPYTKRTISDMYKTNLYSYTHLKKDTRFGMPSPLQRSLMIMCAPKTRPKVAGIPVGPVTMIEPSHKWFLVVTTTPPIGFDIFTEFESYYIHMLFGICDRYIGTIESPFTHLLLQAFRVLEQHWPQILEDIETGSLSATLDIPAEIRQELEQHLKLRKVQERIQYLRREFEKGFDGIAKRIWSKVQLVSGIDLGTSGEELKKSYIKGIPLVTLAYGGTEGAFGLNMSLLAPCRYTLIPSVIIFEFIPIQQSDEEIPRTLFGDAVKVGEQYELVVSNPTCGLYRFRFGDVIKVVDFYHESPVVEFKYRCGQLLNLRGEKVDEGAMFEALKNCAKRWPGLSLFEYSSVESSMMPASERQAGSDHYVVFIEVNGNEGEYVLTTEKKAMIDSALCEQAFAYKSFRDKNSIGPMDVRQVKPGGFAELKKFILEQSTATVNQFKIPRKLKTRETVTYMLQQTFKQ